MPDWVEPVIVGLGAILGSGAASAFIAGRNGSAERKDAAAADDRKDAVAILREMIAAERGEHADCEKRVTAMEAKADADADEAQKRIDAIEARASADREQCIRENAALALRLSKLEKRITPQGVPVQPKEPTP